MNLAGIFKKMCLIRHFELEAAEAFKKGFMPGPVYLSVGQEAVSATISELTKGYAVFSQHRGHSVYLAYGGDPVKLVDELLGRPEGCCRGRGGSPCVQDLNIPMYGHHGLIGENIPLATGYVLAAGRPTTVYFGDAAAEEDYALTSFGFAATHKLPILYVCEDNGLSILTPISARRNWNIYDVAKAMGLATASVEDEPGILLKATGELIKNLPAFINVKTCRHMWHSGIGNDGPPQMDRLGQMKNKISGAMDTEKEIKDYIRSLWQRQLQKQ